MLPFPKSVNVIVLIPTYSGQSHGTSPCYFYIKGQCVYLYSYVIVHLFLPGTFYLKPLRRNSEVLLNTFLNSLVNNNIIQDLEVFILSYTP